MLRSSGLQSTTFDPTPRRFSSSPAVGAARLAEIFSKPASSDELKDVDLDQETVHSALQNLESSPESARRLFDWVAGKEAKENRLLRSKSFNLMLEIVVTKETPADFWGLYKIMKEKGYGISKATFLKVSARFKSEKMEKDLDLLNDLYLTSSSQVLAARVSKILHKGGEAGEIHQKLLDLGVDLSLDLVVAVLEQVGAFPRKASVFFQWVEANPSFEIDGRVSNAMARVLGREDCIEQFWEILHKMRSSGFEMERETFLKVINRFYKRRMIASAVDLFEFAMGGSEKPQFEDFIFLLKRVVVSKDLSTSLVSKVVRIFVSAGNGIKSSAFDGVVKSLTSVGRLGECDKILKAMEGGGFVADASVYGRAVVGLCDSGKLDEALEYANNLEKSGTSLDSNTWTSLVKKNFVAGHMDKALSCFKRMVEGKGGENVGCTFGVLVHEFCRRRSVEDAFKMLKEAVTKINVQPSHATYKFLIESLLGKGKLKEASSLLELMKSHGFPPFIDPFISYISKSGTADDAMVFLKAMTVNEFPSTAVFLRAFEALLKEGRHQVAHDLLSSSPGSVRNHADVLDLFYSMKPEEAATAAAF